MPATPVGLPAWEPGVWADTVWEEGVWAEEGGEPEPPLDGDLLTTMTIHTRQWAD